MSSNDSGKPLFKEKEVHVRRQYATCLENLLSCHFHDVLKSHLQV